VPTPGEGGVTHPNRDVIGLAPDDPDDAMEQLSGGLELATFALPLVEAVIFLAWVVLLTVHRPN
jgi:hypothetical protein